MTKGTQYSSYARKQDRKLGAAYFRDGMTLDDCPFSDAVRKGEWVRGYVAAKKLREEQECI